MTFQTLKPSHSSYLVIETKQALHIFHQVRNLKQSKNLKILLMEKVTARYQYVHNCFNKFGPLPSPQWVESSWLTPRKGIYLYTWIQRPFLGPDSRFFEFVKDSLLPWCWCFQGFGPISKDLVLLPTRKWMLKNAVNGVSTNLLFEFSSQKYKHYLPEYGIFWVGIILYNLFMIWWCELLSSCWITMESMKC